MSKFMITCPVCGRYNEASTGFFASKRIHCTCGNIINVKTDKMASCRCTNCGNDVVYDQSKAKDAKCPVCGEKLLTAESMNKRITFRCLTCACELSAQKGATTYTCPVCDTKIDVAKEARLAEQRDKGIPAVIQYEGGANTLVWKHPMTDFVMGSQLIVHETQEAIFLRNGEALDSFPAGRYDLETGVLPKMNSLFKLPAQGQPFHAEVYFVNLTTLMNIKWGTSSKVGLFDPISGLHVELGASGAFNLRVSDARRLLMRLVGTADALTQEQLFSGETGYFRTLIMNRVKSNLARIIKDNHINVLELDERLDSISAHLQTAINENLAEYGLTMPEFFVSNIVTPDDDPNFRRLKQQHADLYLKTREEQIKKAEAEAAFERKAVEAQTEARMKVIGAQGEADAERIRAQAAADAYRMQAEAEAQEMRMKGYTYQQETARQVGVTAMLNNSGAAGGIGGMAGDVMSVGVGLGAVGSVIGMAKDAITPIAGAVGEAMQPEEGWTCACGQKGNRGNFCMNCGAKKPEPVVGWDCACGQKGNTGNFCMNCGAKKPEMPKPWDCACGNKGILGNFCPNCGAKKPEAPATWDCACGNKGIIGNFCTNCGKKRDEQ